MRALLAAAERAGVQMRTGVVAQGLVRESDGRVAGLRVEQDGAAKYLRAKRGVVLAAGGFIHNAEMLARHAPELAACRPHWGRAGDLGDGIRMGIAVGGNTLRMNQGFAVLPLYPPENVLKGVVVNARGQRFINEDVYYGALGHEVVYRQGGRAWLVVDGQILTLQGSTGARLFRRGQPAAIASSRSIWRSRPRQRTVDYYNEHAAAGRYPQFGKATSFSARSNAHRSRPTTRACGRHSSGRTRSAGSRPTSMRVIDAWGAPIAGLYAAGRTAAGIPVAPYTSAAPRSATARSSVVERHAMPRGAREARAMNTLSRIACITVAAGAMATAVSAAEPTVTRARSPGVRGVPHVSLPGKGLWTPQRSSLFAIFGRTAGTQPGSITTRRGSENPVSCGRRSC